MAIAPVSQTFAQGRLRLIRDAEIEATIRAYADPIFVAAGLDPRGIQVHLIADDKINAFVAGGMRLFINTGLIMRTKRPNDLMGVIAHETGHIAGGHLARIQEELADRTIEAVIGMLLGVGAGIAAGSGGAAAGGAMLGQQIAQRDLLKYSRSQESAADEAGMKYLDATHQSAEGMLSLFEILAQQESLLAGNQDPYLRTHPLTQDRIDAVRLHVEQSPYIALKDPPELMARHQRMLAKLYGYLLPFDRVRTIYPQSDQSEAARYARAIALYRTSKIQEAIKLMDGLLAERPNDPYYIEQKAQILFETGQIGASIPLYQEAADLAPDEALIKFELAQALVESGDPSAYPRAITHLSEVTQREPRNARAWSLLAVAYGQSGDLGMAAVAQAENAYAMGKKKDARMFANRAMDKLPVGSPGWLKAQDIVYAAGGDDEP
jgi:predicted Zn-dependent protease